jgi:hypothetical protein
VSHHVAIIVVVLPSPLHCHNVIIAVLPLPSGHRNFTIAIVVSQYCGVTSTVTVSYSLSWCCICYCDVMFVVAVSHLSSHHCSVELIGTAERAVTTEPNMLKP